MRAADLQHCRLLLTSARRPARIVAVMPVVESLEARIAQVAVPSTSRKSGDSALQQTVNGMYGGLFCRRDADMVLQALNLTLTLGQEQGLAVSSAAVQDVKDIVAEVRRLQAIASASPEPFLQRLHAHFGRRGVQSPLPFGSRSLGGPICRRREGQYR